ncbi:cation transporter [Micrococcus luteus]|nr:cation transporter [Micrococcus luteus]
MEISKMTLFIVGMLTFAIIVSACGSSNERTSTLTTVKTENIEKASFEVTGLTCASCDFVVESAIKRVDGVQNVHVKSDSSTGTARVEFDKSKTDLKTIQKTVLDLGYGIQ